MEPKLFYLKTFNITKNLSAAQVTDLCNNLIHKDAKRKQIIYAKGGGNKVFILISGKIKISEINSSGEEMIKEIILPGDLFGDAMLSSEAINYEYAEVISERVSYYTISLEQLTALMQNNHTLTMNYMAKVSEKFKSLENRYVNMVNKDVRSRLLFCFREWAKKEGKSQGDKVVVKNLLTHNDLANLISTSRQTVTVILNELKEAGAITYNRKEIEFNQLMLAS